MNWFKSHILKRLKAKEPVKKEIPLNVKHIQGFLFECKKTLPTAVIRSLIQVANRNVKEDGYFEINKNLEIEFKSYD